MITTALETVFVHRAPFELFNISKLKERSFAKVWMRCGKDYAL
jgi:hypothetical protein